jgi:hypothetical protein
MVDEPNETGLGPDGMVPPWPFAPTWNQQPMPPCRLCGAAFAAHLDGWCPQPAQPWAAGFQGTVPTYAYWAPALGGPPPALPMAGPRPPRNHWLRRYPLLMTAIMLIVALLSFGIVHEVSHVNAQHSGNGRACSAYWNVTKATNASDVAAEVAGWRNLQVLAPRIGDPTLAAAVQAFEQDLYYADFTDAQIASADIAAACTALGFGNPGS